MQARTLFVVASAVIAIGTLPAAHAASSPLEKNINLTLPCPFGGSTTIIGSWDKISGIFAVDVAANACKMLNMTVRNGTVALDGTLKQKAGSATQFDLVTVGRLDSRVDASSGTGTAGVVCDTSSSGVFDNEKLSFTGKNAANCSGTFDGDGSAMSKASEVIKQILAALTAQ